MTVDYRPRVLGTAKQIHALVCARDRLCDVDRLVGNRARVTGNYTRITMLTERTIATLVTLLNPTCFGLTRRRAGGGSLALIKMSLKFLVGLKEVIITVKQALVADEANYIR